MWIFTSQGMISIVRHREQPQLMMVRARQPEVLDYLFPEISLIVTPDADYRYRKEVPQSDVLEAIDEYLEDMEYDNFKNSISDHDYHNACSRVWSVMYNYQQGMEELKLPKAQEPAQTKYDPLALFNQRPGEQARQKRIARSQFPDDFGGCSDNYR